MDGIGPRTAQAIQSQFKNKSIIKIIKNLQKAGLQFSAPQKQDPKKSNLKPVFKEQSWCVTGSFKNYNPRDLAMIEVKKRGGRVVTGISSKTTHLLAGSAAGSKLDKAEKLGIQIVTEADFQTLLNQN